MTHKESLEMIRLASSELDRLRAEVERLTRERDEARDSNPGWNGAHEVLKQDYANLEAEVERLRAVLQEWVYAIDALQDTSVLSSIPKKMARIKECEIAARALVKGEP